MLRHHRSPSRQTAKKKNPDISSVSESYYLYLLSLILKNLGLHSFSPTKVGNNFQMAKFFA